MKKIILLFLLLLITNSAVAAIITGKVEYSVNDARQSVLSEPQKPDLNLIRANIFDRNYIENSVYLLKGCTDLKDRTLAYFSDGSYAVNYKNDLRHVFYYNCDGILTHTEERLSLEYPYKAYKYKASGELENMTYRVSQQEAYIFDMSAKLIAHWKGSKCYDEDNNVIMTRSIRN